MSSAARRIRQELAVTILATLGSSPEEAQLHQNQCVTDAEAALSDRMQTMINQLCDIGITKARIAREIDVDPAALSELAEGVTSRLGLESLWAAYQALDKFIEHACSALNARMVACGAAHGELLGFSAHPDRAKVTGAEALTALGKNLAAAVGERDGAMASLGPHIKGASAVYTKGGHWILAAIVYPGTPEEMSRVARDEIWHIEQWLRRHDAQSEKPKKLKSAF